MFNSLSDLALSSAIYLDRMSAGVEYDRVPMDAFREKVFALLCKYELEDVKYPDSSLGPTYFADKAFLSGMAELTDKRGRSVASFGEHFLYYSRELTRELHQEAFNLITDLDAVLRTPTPEEAQRLCGALLKVHRGVADFEHDEWSKHRGRRYLAA